MVQVVQYLTGVEIQIQQVKYYSKKIVKLWKYWRKYLSFQSRRDTVERSIMKNNFVVSRIWKSHLNLPSAQKWGQIFFLIRSQVSGIDNTWAYRHLLFWGVLTFCLSYWLHLAIYPFIWFTMWFYVLSVDYTIVPHPLLILVCLRHALKGRFNQLPRNVSSQKTQITSMTSLGRLKHL